ncbi:hypothetical protein Tco_1456852 [Tanacetum coccineum]
MDTPTIPDVANSSEGNFGDDIDIGLDVVHPVLVTTDAFPAVTIVAILASHGEAIQGIHEYLQGVPIEEEMSTLRFRMGMAKAENASLRGKIRNMEAIETVTRSQERRTSREMERISDHSPSVQKIPNLTSPKPKPFKFVNLLVFKSKFVELVKCHWNSNVEGHNMFKVVSNMKALKKPLQKLLHDHGNLHERVNKLRIELDVVQKALDLNPTDSYLREEESVYLKAFNEAKLDEERFLKQKAKIDWLEAGDSNSSYFHKSIKCQNQRSRIEVVVNSDNIEVSGSHVLEVFVSHYEQFLGTFFMECNELNVEGLFSKSISATTSSNMVCDITNDEIKADMFDIGDDKASGPDGYTFAFFKKGWSVVGHDVCNAVRDFFLNRCILKEINHTFLALIPKVSTPLKVNDYRPISCCNVIYKCISKILSNRIIEGIKEVVSDNQVAFVPVMEILSLILKRRVRMSDLFRFHKHCKELEIINVCFMDDLFIFAREDLASARVILESLDEFKMVLGLVPSIPKSTAYFCNVVHHVKLVILNIMPFSEGELPVKYLGVPFISSRLLNKDCKILVEKVKNRIWDWKNKSLSFAGRL